MWKVTMNDCCVKEYKTKHGAMKRGELLAKHTPPHVRINVVRPIEVIKIK